MLLFVVQLLYKNNLSLQIKLAKLLNFTCWGNKKNVKLKVEFRLGKKKILIYGHLPV